MADDPKSPQGLFGDMTRMFSEMRFPSMLPDTGVLMAAHRRNMDVLSQANRLALEGAQAVARRHMEIMQQSMTELTEHVRELAGSDNPKAKAARQAELVKQSYEHAVAHIRELSDLIQRSNTEALQLLDSRFREAIDEIKQLLEKSGLTLFDTIEQKSIVTPPTGPALRQSGPTRLRKSF